MKKIFFACLPLLFIFSCKKEKATCDLNNTNLVGSYKLTAATHKATASSTPVDIFALSDACDKDNVIVLNANGTYNYKDEGLKCDPPSDDTGAWSLNNNILNVDNESGMVTSFNCSGMVLTVTDSDGGVTTQTFTKQ